MRSTCEKCSSFWALAVLVLAAAVNVPKVSAQSNQANPHATTKYVNCDKGDTITATLQDVRPGDTLIISGTCNENLLLNSPTGRYNGLTLDGQGTATIAGPDPKLNVIELTGVSGFTIRGLTITGGNDGLSINTGSVIAIDMVVVQNTGRHGIHFQRGSTMGYVVNSTIQNNPQHGIVINENSYVRVGFTDGVGASQGDTGPCVIQNNGGYGIRIQRGSKARVYTNTISNNANNGINIESASYAEIATHIIDGNGKNGIAVTENSTLHLGNPSGSKNEDQPNTTNTPNGLFGVSISWGSYVSGRVGTLNGASGASTFTHNSNSNLTP
jgi:Periplasmic copper-binding protein (NosD)